MTSHSNVLFGAGQLIRLFQGWARKFWPKMALLEVVGIDGFPDFISHIGGNLQTTALQIEDGRITVIYVTHTPDKLEAIAGRLH